jgi:hypothetical protein
MALPVTMRPLNPTRQCVQAGADHRLARLPFVAATWLIAEIAMQHVTVEMIFFADDFLLGTMGQWFRHIAAASS